MLHSVCLINRNFKFDLFKGAGASYFYFFASQLLRVNKKSVT